MKANTVGIEIGDIVFMHRPVYNRSDEIIPEEKKVRPYCVLDIIGDELLVVGLTTKEHGNFTYKINEGSYAITNDLYLINIRELVNRRGKVEDEIFNNLVISIYFKILKKDKISFNEKIQNLFMNKYKKNTENHILHLIKQARQQSNDFKERDIIYPYIESDKKYIIDKVSEDGYLCYQVTLERNILKIDFSRRIMLSKDIIYFLIKNVSEEDYNNREQAYLRKKYANTHSGYQPKKKVYYQSGDILKCRGKEYFLIYENSDQKLVCIPYKGNYLLDHIKYFNKYECKKLDIRLSNEEKVAILTKVSSNLQIYHNEFLQNAIAAKIKKL